ncbi:hypothetical protein [Ruminococcus sp.]
MEKTMQNTIMAEKTTLSSFVFGICSYLPFPQKKKRHKIFRDHQTWVSEIFHIVSFMRLFAYIIARNAAGVKFLQNGTFGNVPQDIRLFQEIPCISGGNMLY